MSKGKMAKGTKNLRSRKDNTYTLNAAIVSHSSKYHHLDSP